MGLSLKFPKAILLILLMIIGSPSLMPNLKTVSAESTFNDNFDDGVADGWTPQVGSWSVINGEYRVSVGIVENGITTVNGLNLKDCTIETKLRFTDDVGYRAGLVFRYMGKDTYYALEVSNEYDCLGFSKYLPECPDYGTQNYGFGERTPAEIHFATGELKVGDKVIGSVPLATISKNVEYTLIVTITGNTFVGELIGGGVNQTIVWEDKENPFRYGTVGLRARRADAYFDNFRVDNGTNFPLPSPTANPTPKSDLLAWWKLNEGTGTVVTDSSGNNYQGIIHGASWINNQRTSSLSFNGVSDYVSLPSMDLTNLDSLTVVAWINSDLTEVGFIMYHGNLGEFNLGNGDLGQDTQHLNINSTHASFSVKLSDFNWYGTQSSSPMKPNTWHQIVGVWETGVSMKVYVDGVLAGENDRIPAIRLYNPGSSFPSSLGIYSQDQWNQQDFFKGQISNVMVFNKALTIHEINALYDDVPFPTVARPTLDVSCKSSASYSGFNVEISGKLAFNGTAIPYAPILLSYSVTGGKTWEDLTLVNTAPDGSYSATWMPSVTGNYLIKATYEGDDNYLETSTIVNLVVTQSAEKNVFSVTSNSTLSSLIFNSQLHELSFTVTGPEDTMGYVDMYIPNSLIGNIADVKAYIDGDETNYTSTSVGDSWLLHFIYQHSTHEVVLSIGSPPSKLFFDNPFGCAIIISAIIVVCVSLFIYFKKRKH